MNSKTFDFQKVYYLGKTAFLIMSQMTIETSFKDHKKIVENFNESGFSV